MFYALFFSQNSEIHLFPQHWDACTKICELLKEFNDATLALSGVYYPTTHLFLIYAVNIVGKLYEFRDDPILCNAIICIKKKILRLLSQNSFNLFNCNVF